ncbi:hypothetical protein D3C72_1826300 [compost metagenome]
MRLYRDVECGCRLIGNQQFWTGQQSHSNHHALAFTARKLMREIGQAFSGVANTGALKEVQNFPSGGFFTHSAMQRQHFVQLFFQRVQRIQ